MKFLLPLFLPGMALAEAIPVPSGQPVEFIEKIVDADGPAGLTWRYRLVAPDIARDTGGTSQTVASGDIDAICSDFARFEAEQAAQSPAQIIITLMDQFVPFGEPAPHVTQYFEAYRIEDGTCVWEGF